MNPSRRERTGEGAGRRPGDGARGLAVVNMLHHSSSRHQRNRGSRIKTLLQVTLLVGVVVWLLYQVKHSYDKKNEYLDDTEDHLAHDDRSMFQGRKERVSGDGNVEKVGENSDVISKPDEEKSGETVFEKENNDSHEDDARNTERSEAEDGQSSGADGNTEAHSNDEDETTGHSETDKHDAESNSSDAESKSEVHSTGDDVPQNNHAQEESTGETNGTPHEEVAQGDESTNADQTNASSNGSDGEEAEKTGTSDEHVTETLPDETGNVPSVHNENSQNYASENQGDAASTASDASEHRTSENVHIETGYEHEGEATSSGTASGDDEKGAETGSANELSESKEANSEEGNAATEVSDDQAANTETENSQGVSTAEVANGSSEETKPVENQSDGATETPNNGEQEDIKIKTSTSINDEHNESQGGDGSSGSNGSNDSGPEQTGKTETQ